MIREKDDEFQNWKREMGNNYMIREKDDKFQNWKREMGQQRHIIL